MLGGVRVDVRGERGGDPARARVHPATTSDGIEPEISAVAVLVVGGGYRPEVDAWSSRIERAVTAARARSPARVISAHPLGSRALRL
jgi:hypothetical protein